MNDKVDDIAQEQVAEPAAAADDRETAMELARTEAARAAASEAGGQSPRQSAGTDATGTETQHRPGRSWLSTLLLFCLTAAGIGAGGYFIHDLNERRNMDRTERAALADRLDALQHSHTLLAETQRRLESRQDQADEQLRATVQHLGALQRQAGSATGWQFEEIKFLLRVASQRLALAGDVDTALAVLRSADTLLRDIPDPALIPVRARLTRDIQRLQAHPRTDFSGTALALGDLAARARQLPLKTGAAGETSAPAPQQPDPQPRWRELAGNVWQELKSLVVITRDSGQSAALLAPAERFFLHRNLRLQLDAARLALLARDENQYQASIQAGTAWLQEFFRLDDAGVQGALEILRDAAALELDRPVPSLEATWNAFDEYLLRQDGPYTYRGAQ